MVDEFLPTARGETQKPSRSPSKRASVVPASSLMQPASTTTLLRSKSDIITVIALSMLSENGSIDKDVLGEDFHLTRLNVVFRDRRAFLEVPDDVATAVAQARAGGGHLVNREVSVSIKDLMQAVIEAVRFFEALVTQARALSEGE